MEPIMQDNKKYPGREGRERPILFSGEMVRAILEGRKTQTRRVMKVQPEGTPASLELWADGLAETCRAQGTVVTRDQVREKAEQLRGRIFPFVRPNERLIGYSCPYGVPGDRLWVRETWGATLDYPTPEGSRMHWWHEVPIAMRGPRNCQRMFYRADLSEFDWYHSQNDAVFNQTLQPDDFVPWRPSIHMPRWASRLTLEITEVRVERVRDISYGDMIAEGCPSEEPWTKDPVVQMPADVDAFRNIWDSLNAKRGYGWDVNPYVWCISFKVAGPPEREDHK